MDPVAGFDDDEHEDFFRRYDAERARQSPSALELEAAEPTPPSPEQLAHFGRFRKPVALIVGAMSILSVAGLALRRSQHTLFPEAPRAHRSLVAHYGAALTAPTSIANAPPASATSAAPVLLAPGEGYVWKALTATPNMCVLDPNLESAWLSVGLEPPGSEWSAVRLGRASSSRGRRPASMSNLDGHIAPPAHGLLGARPAPLLAAPALTPALKPPVARFPDNR